MALILALLVVLVAVTAQPPLESYNVDIKQSSVSGLSAGGYFAVQMSIAYSSIIRGAGIFAGGPYNCAQGQLGLALGSCMSGFPQPNPQSSVDAARARAALGVIDPLEHAAQQRVFLFSGTLDSTVRQPVMNSLNTFYRTITQGQNGSVVYMNSMAAAHTQPTDDRANRNSCTTTGSPYISFCDYDGAGQALKHIYGPLRARNEGAATGRLLTFAQAQFIPNPTSRSMSATGYVYVPASCQRKELCRLHVAFHGCVQGADAVGTAYVTNAGYNKWADTNNLIILYPQAQRSILMPSNPNGCLDWWGYNSPLDYDLKSGAQMAGVYAMMQHIARDHVSGPATLAPSSAPTAPTLAPPLLPPSNLHTTAVTTTSVTLAWTKSAGSVSGYTVHRDGALVATVPATAALFLDTGLTAETRYVYTVAALRGAEQSAPSQPLSVLTAPSWQCQETFSSNFVHVSAGRAIQIGGIAYAVGSGDHMGLWNTFVSSRLAETSHGYYRVGSCPSTSVVA